MEDDIEFDKIQIKRLILIFEDVIITELILCEFDDRFDFEFVNN